MTIVHSEAPWGHSQEERLAPKERTHPMRPLSRNNNTTTRLKRGPNPLSGVLILVLIFFVFFLYFVFLYFFLSFLMFYLFIYFFVFCLFVCLFVLLLFIIFFFVSLLFFLKFIFHYFFYICAYMFSPWGQPQQTIKSPGYREVLILSLGS